MNEVRHIRMTEREPADPSARAVQSSDERCESVESWLTLFSGLLHLPTAERDSIHDEIGSHLRERVRDLMLEGYNETNAIHAATRELGDAAELAKKFESVAKGRTRRHIMHLAILGTGVITAATAGVLVLKPEVTDQGNSAVSYFEESRQSPEAEPPDKARETRITITPDMTLREILDKITESADLGVAVDWEQMMEVGLVWSDADNAPPSLDLAAEEISALATLALLRHRSDEVLDWRFRENDLLELGTQEQFDLAEMTLASYDIADILVRLRNEYELEYGTATEAIVQVITKFVEPELWEDNGGALGQLSIVGGTLFINAPPRMHEKTAWILDELRKQGTVDLTLEVQPIVNDVPVLSEIFDQTDSP